MLPGTLGCSGDCCAAGDPMKQVVPGRWPENLAQSPPLPTAASSLVNEGPRDEGWAERVDVEGPILQLGAQHALGDSLV